MGLMFSSREVSTPLATGRTGVNAFGFKGREKELERWMAENGFNPSDLHHSNLDLYD
jgi:hypothetical protein